MSTVDEEPLALDLLKLLLARLTSPATEDQLAPELPLKRDAPLVCSALINDGVVMLEVGTEALGLQRNPKSVLMHGVGVLGPVAEVVCVRREGLAEVLDWLRVLVEEDLSEIGQSSNQGKC